MLIVSAGGCSITRVGAACAGLLVSGFPVRGLIVGGWCVRAGSSLPDLPAGCGHSFQRGRRGTGCRSRCLRVFPGVLCAVCGCACWALCRRARILTGHSRRGALCGFQRGQGVRPSLLPDDLRGAVGVLAVCLFRRACTMLPARVLQCSRLRSTARGGFRWCQGGGIPPRRAHGGQQHSNGRRGWPAPSRAFDLSVRR